MKQNHGALFSTEDEREGAKGLDLHAGFHSILDYTADPKTNLSTGKSKSMRADALASGKCNGYI